MLQVHAGGFSVGIEISVPKQWDQQQNLVTDALNNFNLTESGEHGYINLARGPFSIQSLIFVTAWPHRLTEKMPIGDTKQLPTGVSRILDVRLQVLKYDVLSDGTVCR